jgi:hypothetical protein
LRALGSLPAGCVKVDRNSKVFAAAGMRPQVSLWALLAGNLLPVLLAILARNCQSIAREANPNVLLLAQAAGRGSS